MPPGVVQLVVGAVLIGAGLSGKVVMRGTQSGTGLVIVGGALILLGVFRLVRSRQQPPPGGDGPQS